MMESFLIATALGAIAEVGDKSQFMLFILSFRFRNSAAAVASGMVCAMVVAHVPAGFAGAWFAAGVEQPGLRLAVGSLFLAMAALASIAKLTERLLVIQAESVFFTVLATIFLAEIGNKSQMASALVAMRDGSAIPLVGTILGCVMINIPIVMAGPWLAEKIVSRGITLDRLSFLIAVLFATLGLSVIFDLLP